MARTVHLPAQDYAPGSYSAEIDTPNRASGARLTFTREAPGWPAGDLFDLRVFEQDRGGALHLLYSTRMAGGQVVHPATGVVNPPAQIGLEWPADRDKDRIRFEADVLQNFRTDITLEFV